MKRHTTRPTLDPLPANEDTVLKSRNVPLPPATSWWLGKSRSEFSDALEQERSRMSGSPLPGRASLPRT
jgi:hypothetical protein